MTDPQKALIVGPYRAHNFGDDLVGAILARHLQRLSYDVTVPRLGEENARWLGIPFHEDYEGLFEAADVVVVGGGGIMSDTSGANPGASYLGLVAQAGMDGYLLGKKTFVTSVGAGPWILESSRRLAYAVSLVAERIGVREQESYDHLRKLGVGPTKLVLGADLALLTPELLDFAVTPSGKLGLQFDVSGFSDLQDNPELPEIVATIEAYARAHSSEVTLIRNGRARSELAAAAPDAERLSYTELPSFLPRLAGLRALFTSHLHLAITSYAQRIPTYSLFAREKTRRFYEQIGHPERAIDLRTATVPDLERFLSAVETVTWTAGDELTMQRLKGESWRLLDFIR